MRLCWFFLCLLFLSTMNASATGRTLNFNQEIQVISEHSFWYDFDPALVNEPLDAITQSIDLTVFSQPKAEGQAGAFASFLNVPIDRPTQWFITLGFSYIEQGIVYWKPDNGPIQTIFSTTKQEDVFSPWILHSNVFPIQLPEGEAGQLWLIIETPFSVNSKELKVFTNEAFYKNLFISNTLTILTLSVMGLLSFLSLLIYARTGYRLAILCAGNTGFHMIGWMGATGLLNYFFPINLSDIHHYFFLFGIFCAVLFLRELFNFQKRSKIIDRILVGTAILAMVLSVISPFTPIHVAFFISLMCSSLWVFLNFGVSLTLLFSKKHDYRARYYIIGSFSLLLSLLYYLVAKSPAYETSYVPEVGVMVAFTIECICILLSLTEWLRLKQEQLNKMTIEARIDPLTGVGNRLLMNERLSTLKKYYTIVFIDFDGMKGINDTYGHVEGDRFLSFVANHLSLRLKGIGDVFRAGGDEFVVIAEHNNDETMHSKLKSALKSCEQSLQLTWPKAGLSFGIVDSSPKYTAEECVKLADTKMYEDKYTKRKSILSPVAIR